MPAELSILEVLKKGSFQASLITTFNAYLPFYEEVVYRKLHAAGCHHNVVLMDAGQMSQCLSSPSTRPRRAGHEYTLVPVRAPGAFHPKIVFLTGKKRVAVLVGSHNLTFSGFGYNRELTTHFTVAGRNDKEGVDIAAAAWEFISTWIDTQGERLQKEVVESVQRVRQFCPWVKRRAATPRGIEFFGSSPEGESLWERVRDKLPKSAVKVLVLGAFFDKGLGFVNQLVDDVSPSEIVIGIDPDTVDMPTGGSIGTRHRFVDASGCATGTGYLHAKALYFDTGGGDDALVIGSANPTGRAWTDDPGRRNAEAVVVHRGSIARSIAHDLNLPKLLSLPALSAEKLREVHARSGAKPTTSDTPPVLGAVAVPSPDGFTIAVRDIDTGAYSSASIWDEHNELLDETSDIESSEDGLLVRCDDLTRAAARIVEVSGENAKKICCIVHHTSRIDHRSRTGKQTQFRDALASLDGEEPDLAGLLGTVNKIIFSDEFDVAQPKKPGSGGAKKEIEKPEEVGSLAVDSEKARRKKRRGARRIVETGDLGYLLDALIYQIGRGLEPALGGVDGKGRSEEEQIGADDDDGEEPLEPERHITFKDPEVLKTCHRKVRTLVNRMVKQLGRADEGKHEPERALIQLVGVLAVLRELRIVEKKAKEAHRMWWSDTLVPLKQRKNLFDQSTLYLFGAPGLFKQVVDEYEGDEEIDEISRLRGLLLWLAWDAEVDIRDQQLFLVGRKEADLLLRDKVHMLALAPSVVERDLAVEETFASVTTGTLSAKMVNAEQWLQHHVGWCEAIAGFDPASASVKPGEPRPGDLAFLKRGTDRGLRIVLSAGDGKVELSCLERHRDHVKYTDSAVGVAAL